MKTNAEKLRLIAEYIKNNTKLPSEVEQFLIEMARRADSWDGNVPYKPNDWDKQGDVPGHALKAEEDGTVILERMDKFLNYLHTMDDDG